MKPGDLVFVADMQYAKDMDGSPMIVPTGEMIPATVVEVDEKHGVAMVRFAQAHRDPDDVDVDGLTEVPIEDIMESK